MFVLYALVAGLAIGWLRGGTVEALGRTSVRLAPLALLGLAVQIALFAEPVTSRVGELGPPLYVGSTLAVFVVVLANLRLAGVPLIALGAASNLAAIVANGGYMPADPGALAAAGETIGEAYSNSRVITDPALPWLGDVFALPAWMPLANVFSIGDVLISVGLAWAVAAAMRRQERAHV